VTVARAIVDDDALEIGVILIDDRLKSVLDNMRIFEMSNNDAALRQFG
jgi:hypothetical protein